MAWLAHNVEHPPCLVGRAPRATFRPWPAHCVAWQGACVCLLCWCVLLMARTVQGVPRRGMGQWIRQAGKGQPGPGIARQKLTLRHNKKKFLNSLDTVAGRALWSIYGQHRPKISRDNLMECLVCNETFKVSGNLIENLTCSRCLNPKLDNTCPVCGGGRAVPVQSEWCSDLQGHASQTRAVN